MTGAPFTIPARAPDWHVTVPARLQAVSDALVALRTTIRTVSAPARADGMWELVLAEIGNNIVEHACTGRAGETFDLSIWVEGAQLTARFSDRGIPMPGLTTPDTPLPQAETLPEGGFGWPLIHALCDAVHYRHAGGRNILTVAIPLARPGENARK